MQAALTKATALLRSQYAHAADWSMLSCTRHGMDTIVVLYSVQHTARGPWQHRCAVFAGRGGKMTNDIICA